MEHNVYRSLPLEHVLKEIKSLHTFTLYYVNIQFKITIQPILCVQNSIFLVVIISGIFRE